ncbi:MAG TPA: DUF4405 domain-containing protein [Syntrophobacteraceae bacterium]|nr:DUF4405 domain-containing protein [Syntrophobacteraceae bacterium]
MKLRKTVSLTAFLSFMLVILTSVILYIVPQGRVAYWADWRLWGLSKTQWTEMHLNLGLLFLIALGLHVYYNWSAIVSYLKDKTRTLVLFPREFSAALVLVLVFGVGTYLEVPPFLWVRELSTHFKEEAARKYGEPPYGHAELSSLESYTGRMGLDLDQSLAGLKKAGMAYDHPGQTLLEIARRNGVPPKVVDQALRSAHPPVHGSEVRKLPDSPPAGFGRRKIEEIAGEYGLDVSHLVRDLTRAGIRATSQESIKEIASRNGKAPVEIYELIRTHQNKGAPVSP